MESSVRSAFTLVGKVEDANGHSSAIVWNEARRLSLLDTKRCLMSSTNTRPWKVSSGLLGVACFGSPTISTGDTRELSHACDVVGEIARQLHVHANSRSGDGTPAALVQDLSEPSIVSGGLVLAAGDSLSQWRALGVPCDWPWRSGSGFMRTTRPFVQ